MTKEYEKLEPTFKAKWIKALLSGKYVQGRRALRSCDDEYCCLGVAADIIDPSGWVSQGDRRDWEYVEDDAQIPDVVAEKFGLRHDAQTRLVELNDESQTDFPTIAAWIEEYL